MKRWLLVLPGLLLLGAASNWGMKFNTGFETPNYKAGLPLVGQDDWLGLGQAPNAAVIVENPRLARSGRRAVRVLSSDLAHPLHTTNWRNGVVRRPVEIDAVTIPAEVRVEADVRLDGPLITGGGPESDLVSINLYARNGPRRSALFYLSGNGNAYANSITTEYQGGDPTKPIETVYEHEFETPIKIGDYNNLAITLNYKTQLATFEVNRVTIGQLPFGGPDQQFMDVLIEFAALTTEYVEKLYPGQYPNYDPMAYTAYWDNVKVHSKPAR